MLDNVIANYAFTHVTTQAALVAQDLEAKGFFSTLGKAALGIVIVLLAIGLVIGLIIGFFIGRAVGRGAANR